MLRKLKLKDLNTSPATLFKELACVTCFGTMEDHNSLSVGWATLGILWRMEIAEVFIKPNRYSFKYAENSKYFSLMWFDKEHHDDLIRKIGSTSGRDINKDKEFNLTPILLDDTVCYEEATLIITCEKIYSHSIDKNKILSEEVKNLPLYQDNLFHSSYVGKIINVYQKDEGIN